MQFKHTVSRFEAWSCLTVCLVILLFAISKPAGPGDHETAYLIALILAAWPVSIRSIGIRSIAVILGVLACGLMVNEMNAKRQHMRELEADLRATMNKVRELQSK